MPVRNFINTTDEFSGCGSSYFQHPKRIKLPHIYNFPSKFLVFVTQQHKEQEDPAALYPNISQYMQAEHGGLYRKKLYMHHRSALSQLSYITMAQDVFIYLLHFELEKTLHYGNKRGLNGRSPGIVDTSADCIEECSDLYSNNTDCCVFEFSPSKQKCACLSYKVSLIFLFRLSMYMYKT